MISRFVSTWLEHPPGIETDVLAICNGGLPNSEQGIMLTSLKSRFYPRSNEGFDIAGYIECSKGILAAYDMVLFLGESNYFWKEGWLKRLVEARERYGPGMYSPFATHVIRAHLQTTAFFITPSLLASYPFKVTDKESRYALEHGPRALWRRLHARNIPVRLVTWDGCWAPGQWRLPKNGLWSGDQSNLLFHCNHSQAFAEADETRKRNWAQSADRSYR